MPPRRFVSHLFLVRSQVITMGHSQRWSVFIIPRDSPDSASFVHATGFLIIFLASVCYSYTHFVCRNTQRVQRCSFSSFPRGQKPNCTWLRWGEVSWVALSFAQCAVPTMQAPVLRHRICSNTSFDSAYTWIKRGRWKDIDLGQVRLIKRAELTRIYDRRRILFWVLPLPRNCPIEMRCQTVKKLIISASLWASA